MYQFCEAPVGMEGRVCGNRPQGRCYACGRFVCRVHSLVEEGKLYCLDCSPANKKENPRTRSQVETQVEVKAESEANSQEDIYLPEDELEISEEGNGFTFEEEKRSIWEI